MKMHPTSPIVKFARPAALCLILSAFVSGCASERFGAGGPVVASPQQNGAPLGEISQADLPPPDGADMDNTTAVTAASAPPADALDLTPASVAGVWRASLGGMTCQLATPQTKAGKGYRAGSIRCPAVLGQVGSWNINGKQLMLYDKAGKDLAVLYSTGANGFSGRTGGGMPVTLSR